jgi:hypothetical protein
MLVALVAAAIASGVIDFAVVWVLVIGGITFLAWAGRKSKGG